MASPQKIISLFSIIIAVIGILWIFLYNILKEEEPNLWKPIQTTAFDYIVVGGGTAGSVVATLLSKHSNSTVLLIEAGDKFGLLSKIPLLTTFMQRGINDWTFLSVPQKHSSMGLHERRQALPRGKGLGGSSQINYMLHFDGYEKDFDRWQAMGLHKWSYTAFKPYLDAARPKPDELLTIARHYSKLSEALHRAQNDFEHKPWNFRRAQYTIKKGYRLGVYSRYLQTVFGKWNLKIITNALVRRVNINSGVAQSVTIGVKDDSGRETRYDISANKEIILSCGAYQSPQILLLSGLGSRKILEALKIPTVKDLTQVGQNLFDHMNLPLFVSIAERASINSNTILSVTEMFEYLSTGKGHFGNFGVIGNIDILDKDSGLILFGVGGVDESVLMSISNFKREHFRALFPLYYNTTQEGFVFISTCYQPISRGTVRIRSDNVRRNPLIDPNYLAKEEDFNCTLSAVQTAAKIVTSEAFSILKPKIHWPKIKQCLNFGPFERDFKWNQPSENYLKCLLRHVGLTSHHPGGTCAMGLSEGDSVVDQELRVHGVKGLRVIDASVLPTPLTGNPNSIIEAIAIRGTSFILRSNEKSSNNNKL